MTRTLRWTAFDEPRDALGLPKGGLIVQADEMFSGAPMESPFSPEDVAVCVALIAGKAVVGRAEFSTQAEVVAYAGNNLGWGIPRAKYSTT